MLRRGKTFGGKTARAAGLALLLAFASARTGAEQVVLLACSVAFADETPPRIKGDGGAIARPPVEGPTGQEKPEAETRPRPDVAPELVPEVDERSILLDLPRLESLAQPFGSGSILNEVSVAPDEPGSVVTSYEGLEGVCVSRIQSYGRRLWRDEMQERWSRSTVSLFDFEAAERRWYERQQDLTIGRWWERSWRASFVPERGGAPATARLVTVGKNIEVLRVGEMVLTTAGKIRLGNIWFYIDDERIYEALPERQDILGMMRARTDAQLGRSGTTTADAHEADLKQQRERERDKAQRELDAARDRAVDMSLGWIVEDDAARDLLKIRGGAASRYAAARLGVRRSVPRGNVYTGKSWNLSIRPTLSFKGTLRPEDALSSASLDCRVRLFRASDPSEPWGAFVLSFKAQPSREQAQVTASFELLRW